MKSKVLRKLGNAIRAYRGATHAAPGGKQVWIHPPQIGRRADIVRHLLALGRTKEQINLDAMVIDSFNHIEQMRQFMKTIEAEVMV